jgi:hypothetical protein
MSLGVLLLPVSQISAAPLLHTNNGARHLFFSPYGLGVNHSETAATASLLSCASVLTFVILPRAGFN